MPSAPENPDGLVNDAIIDELVAHLRNLICIDTTILPGNEIQAARYIADVFQKEGIQAEIIELAPGRQCGPLY